jgi:hypothetical protein
MKRTHLLNPALVAAGLALSLAQPAAAVEDSNFRSDSIMDLYSVCSTP